MSLEFRSWAHELSYYYRLPMRHIENLLQLGVLPPESSRTAGDKPNTRLALWRDEAMIAKLEDIRPRFNTPVAPFLAELHDLAIQLTMGVPEKHERALAEFRCFSLGRLDAAYPVTPYTKPWGFGHHRVPVTRAELLAAGYADFLSTWNYGDPFAAVPIDGTIPLGSFKWIYHGKARLGADPKARGEFLLRLHDVLKSRVEVRS